MVARLMARKLTRPLFFRRTKAAFSRTLTCRWIAVSDPPGELLDGRRLQGEQVRDLASVPTRKRREDRVQLIDSIDRIVHNNVNYRWRFRSRDG